MNFQMINIGSDRFPQALVRRPDGFNESNDCTIRSLVNTTGIPYQTVHKLFADAGRLVGHPTNLHHTIYTEYSKSHRLFDRSKRPTVAMFIESHRSGKWIVKIDRHVFALVDGRIIDSAKVGVRRRVHSYWEMK